MSSRPCDTSKAIFSRKKVCPELANATVTKLIKIFLLVWAGLILVSAQFGIRRNYNEIQSDGFSKEIVSLLLEL